MRPTVLNTRTAPNNGQLTEALVALGYDVTEAPLLRVEATGAAEPAGAARARALFVTSTHAVAAASRHRDLPTYAVGESTARALRETGFHDVRVGPGDARGLAAKVIADDIEGPVLYPCAQTVAFDVTAHWRARGIEGIAWTVYRTVPAIIDDNVARTVRAGGYRHVVLTSTRSAEAFAALSPAPAGDMRIAAMSTSIASALPVAWEARTRVAAEPNEAALLLLLRGN